MLLKKSRNERCHRLTFVGALAMALAATSAAGLHSVRADEPARTLDSHCPFTPPSSLEQWQARSAELKLQLQVAVGLLPAPQLDPVKPDIYARRDMDGYSVESCTFESLPGLLVTGSLYRPAQIANGQRVPGILCPHGHWPNGRFYESPDVKKELASGAERFESAAYNPIQARCVQLARMGCIVFQYDMLGYADSQQISLARAHGFANQPVESEVTENGWLLYSPLAESHLQSVMGLQTLGTSRAIDMLLTLPEVDPLRIGITGASGGGTQTFIASALDPRIAVAFPAVMVSTGMQGGCTCESCNLLRTGTGNVEIAGLFAPKPLGMTAADDWTRTMPTDGFPELQKLYALYGQKEMVALFPSLHFGHNYNHVSRVSMYGWMNDHFRLGLEKPILERDFQRLSSEHLTVFDADHPRPEAGDEFERRLLKLWSDIVDTQMVGLLQGDQQQNQQLSQVLNDGWRVVLGLTTGSARQSVPAVLQEGPGNETAVSIRIGDHRWHYQPNTAEQALVQYKRLAACYTYGYNACQFASQAQQLGLAIQKLAQQHAGSQVEITGPEASGALAAAAVFVAEQNSAEQQQPLHQLVVNLQDPAFRFAAVNSIRDANFLPGAARFWDLPGLVACLHQPPLIADNSTAEDFHRLSLLRRQ